VADERTAEYVPAAKHVPLRRHLLDEPAGPRAVQLRRDRAGIDRAEFPGLDPGRDRGEFDQFAYEPTFAGGLFVAAADIDGDGRADIVTGTDTGGGPRVRVLDGTSGGSR
jgi:hypothetical protein